MDSLFFKYVLDKYFKPRCDQKIWSKISYLSNKPPFSLRDLVKYNCYTLLATKFNTHFFAKQYRMEAREIIPEEAFGYHSNVFKSLLDAFFIASDFNIEDLKTYMFNLKGGGYIFIELSPDSLIKYRNFENIKEIELVENSEHGIIFRKRKLNITYSKNFWRYKKKCRPDWQSNRNYNHLARFNAVCEKFNIKYSVIGGTALGLARNGGIIPWDDDVDAATTPYMWELLRSKQKHFRWNGMKYFYHRPGRKHIGAVDLFGLRWLNKNNLYTGPLKASVSKVEWENVEKQIFGLSHVYAPLNLHRMLSARYGKHYYDIANGKDAFHGRCNFKNFQLLGEDRGFICPPEPY